MKWGEKLPDTITVKVYPSEDPGIWIAEVPEVDLMTQGHSIADAVYMASDCLKMATDECKDPEVPHCWCRPDVMSGIPKEPPIPAVRCCLCGERKPTH